MLLTNLMEVGPHDRREQRESGRPLDLTLGIACGWMPAVIGDGLSIGVTTRYAAGDASQRLIYLQAAGASQVVALNHAQVLDLVRGLTASITLLEV